MLDKLVVKLLTVKMWLSSERGQDLLEYALIGGVVAAAIIAAAAFLSQPVQDMFVNIGNCITFDDSCHGLPLGS